MLPPAAVTCRLVSNCGTKMALYDTFLLTATSFRCDKRNFYVYAAAPTLHGVKTHRPNPPSGLDGLAAAGWRRQRPPSPIPLCGTSQYYSRPPVSIITPIYSYLYFSFAYETRLHPGTVITTQGREEGKILAGEVAGSVGQHGNTRDGGEKPVCRRHFEDDRSIQDMKGIIGKKYNTLCALNTQRVGKGR